MIMPLARRCNFGRKKEVYTRPAGAVRTEFEAFSWELIKFLGWFSGAQGFQNIMY